MKKYTLPPRDWYTLEQTIKRIKTLTGEELTLDDLLHYSAIEKLKLSVRFSLFPACMNIGSKEIEFNQNTNNLIKLKILKNNYFSIERIFKIRKGNEYEYKNSEITLIAEKSEDYNHYDYIEGFMNIYGAFQQLPFDYEDLLKNGVVFNCIQSILSSPYQQNGNRVLIHFWHIEEDFIIPFSDIVILNSDLELFLTGKFETLEEVIKNAGRPKEQYLAQIIELGKKTFSKYPNASANKIAEAVRAYLIARDKLKETEIIKTNRILEHYKQQGIGASPKEQKRDLKITITA